jgi:hypothetical protein
MDTWDSITRRIEIIPVDLIAEKTFRGTFLM